MGKYEEALERARAGKPIDEVFPELKESEDERIIDDAIQIIRASLLRYAEYSPEADKHRKAIAYLEKQKEQKPINDSTREKIISRATPEKQVVLISESNGKAEIGWDTRSLEDAKKLLEYGLAFINENGIKPAEKQDCSGLNYIERAIHRGFLSAGVEDVLVEIIKETAQYCLAQIDKPAEWSEDEKEFIKHCVELIDGRGEPMCAIRLESLLSRSLWKPSERQMDAFRTSTSYWRGTTKETPSVRALESLYCNLKDYFKI